MEENPNVPFILGRTFLAIGRALIDVQSGGLTLRVNGKEVNFSIYRSRKPNDEKVTCHRVESIRSHVVNTKLGLKPEVSWKVCLTSPKVDGLQSIDEDSMNNLYAQEVRHKESTLFHDREE